MARPHVHLIVPALLLVSRAAGLDCAGNPFALDGGFHFPLEDRASAVVLADFDADGDLDVAGVSPRSQSVVTYRFEEGVFTDWLVIHLPAAPAGIAAADLDGDGRPDLAVSIPRAEGGTGGSVAVLLGRRDGSFATPRLFPAGEEPSSLLAADLDGDGDQDLATVDPGSGMITVLWNVGAAAYGAPLALPAGREPRALAAGDLDGDGDLDLIVAAEGSDAAAIILREGGGYRPPVFLPAGSRPHAVLVEDFDGDGRLDLAVVHSGDQEVTLFENRGGAVFSPARSFDAGGGALAAAAADLDGDRHADLVVGNRAVDLTGVGSASQLFWSPAKGGFRAPLFFYAYDLTSIAAGDVDGDGRLDLVTAGIYGARFHRNRSDQAFDSGVELGEGAEKMLRRVEAVDLDHDGRLDLVVQNTGYGDNNDLGSTLLFWNEGDARFSTAESLPGERVRGSPLAVDLDADGLTDLAIAGETLGEAPGITIYWNEGRRVLGVPTILLTEGYPQEVIGADLDGDGDLDLLTSTFYSTSVEVHQNRGNRSFQKLRSLTLESGTFKLRVGDLDGNRDLDLVAVNQQADGIAVYSGGRDGAYTLKDVYPAAKYIYGLALSDLDGDGDLDMAATSDIAGSIYPFLNGGDGRFTAAAPLIAGGSPYSVEAADLDRDGLPDLLTTNYERSISILLNRGGGSFFPPAVHSLGGDSWSVKAADLDGDGDLDLAASWFGGITIYRNEIACAGSRFHRGDPDSSGAVDLSDAVLLLDFLFQAGSVPACLEAGDVQDDGAVDLSDPISILSFLFQGGPPPAAPGPPPAACGRGSGRLGCAVYDRC